MLNTIAVIFSERGGSSYHRQVTPHAHLSQTYKDLFEVLFFGSFEEMKAHESYSKIKLVQIHRFLPEEQILEIKQKGIVVVLDEDDYWILPKYSPSYYNYQHGKVPEKILKSISLADGITTTTTILGDKISNETSSKITVIPNAIDQLIPQFRPQLKAEEEIVKIGWLGSLSHVNDLASMAESFKLLHKYKPLWRKWQLILGGFDMSAPNLTQVRIKSDGTLEPKKIQPYESLYGIMERIFTNEYKVFKGKEFDSYLHSLARFSEAEDQKFASDTTLKYLPYKRLWSKDVTKYMEMYNELDIVFIPVINDDFNNCKSELKLIEAGFFGKAVIISEVEPYLSDLRPGENCLTVKPGREGIDFFTKMKYLIENPDEIKRLGRNLRSDMMGKFNMDLVNKKRCELYEKLIRQKNTN